MCRRICNFAVEKMATKLTIDEGNSSVKLALWRGDVMEQEVTCRHGDLADMERVVAEWGHVDAAIYCSVCSPDRSQVLDFLKDLKLCYLNFLFILLIIF